MVNDSILPNDTLLTLLNTEFGYDSLTLEIAEKNFNNLVNYGFHESAYNLLYERYEYYFIKWDTDKLEEQLTTKDKYTGAWLEDNTK